MAKRIMVNLDEKAERLFGDLRKSFSGSDSAFFVQILIDRAAQGATGTACEMMDEEDLAKFRYLIKHNDMSPVEIIKKLVRREFWNHTDGKSQRQLVEDISVTVREILRRLPERGGDDLSTSGSDA